MAPGEPQGHLCLFLKLATTMHWLSFVFVPTSCRLNKISFFTLSKNLLSCQWLPEQSWRRVSCIISSDSRTSSGYSLGPLIGSQWDDLQRCYNDGLTCKFKCITYDNEMSSCMTDVLIKNSSINPRPTVRIIDWVIHLHILSGSSFTTDSGPQSCMCFDTKGLYIAPFNTISPHFVVIGSPGVPDFAAVAAAPIRTRL